METVLWVLALLLLAFMTVCILPFSIRINYTRQGENDNFIVAIQLWPGLRYRLAATSLNLTRRSFRPVLELQTEMEDSGGEILAKEKEKVPFPNPPELYRQIKFWLGVYDLLKPSLENMKNKTELSRFIWKTGLGLGDPYYTGIAAGAIWSLKGWLAGYFYQLFPNRTATPQIEVVPGFNRKGFAVYLDCIFKTRIGYIIFTGFKMIAVLIFTGKLKEIVKRVAKK